MLKGMVVADRQASNNRRAAWFFGTVLCLLLAFFAVERRIAAYPAHDVAARSIAATGVQKPEQIALEDLQGLKAPVLFVCALFLLIAFAAQCAERLAEPGIEADFPSWAPIPLAVRPPPTL